MRLVGYAWEHRKPWACVAQTNPGGLADASQGGPICLRQVGSCCNIGEAKRPGCAAPEVGAPPSRAGPHGFGCRSFRHLVLVGFGL